MTDNNSQHGSSQGEEQEEQVQDDRSPGPLLFAHLTLPAVAWAAPALMLYCMHLEGFWESASTTTLVDDLLPICIAYGIGQVLSWALVLLLILLAARSGNSPLLLLYGQVQEAGQSCGESSDARSRSPSPKRRSLSPASIVPIDAAEETKTKSSSRTTTTSSKASKKNKQQKRNAKEQGETKTSLVVEKSSSQQQQQQQRTPIFKGSYSVPARSLSNLTPSSVRTPVSLPTPPCSILRKDCDSSTRPSMMIRQSQSLDGAQSRSIVRFDPDVQIIQSSVVDQDVSPPPIVVVVDGTDNNNDDDATTTGDRHHYHDGESQLEHLNQKLGDIRKEQAVHQQSWSEWKRERAMRKEQAGLNDKAAAAADFANEEEYRYRHAHLVQQEDKVLREIQTYLQRIAMEQKEQHEEAAGPIPDEASHPRTSPSCLGFIYLALRAILQILQVCLLSQAVSHVSATIVACVHAVVYMLVILGDDRLVLLATLVALTQTAIAAWWHEKECCTESFDFGDNGSTESSWWQGLLFATGQSCLSVMTLGHAIPCSGRSAWSRFLKRQCAPVGSTKWVKQLTLETFGVVLLVTSIMAVVDIRDAMTWQDEGENWRDDATTWGALSLVWGLSRAVLLLSPPNVRYSHTSIGRVWCLAPILSIVIVWVTLLVASRWYETLEADGQDWILPDSLLYLGAASVLAMAGWAAT